MVPMDENIFIKSAWTPAMSIQSSTKEQPAKKAALKNDFVRDAYLSRYLWRALHDHILKNNVKGYKYALSKIL